MIFQQQMNRSSNTDYEEPFKINKKNYSSNRDEEHFFLKYANSNTKDRYNNHRVQTLGSGISSNKRYPTEISQTSHFDAGFKKMKYNQLQAFKQLKQEYEILRDLPIQQTTVKETRVKKHSESMYSSSRTVTDNMSESSKQSNFQKKKKKYYQQTSNRQTQMLSLEKKQLQMVVSNSMRKVEQLLNNQVEYKRIIHQLQNQLDSRNVDEQYESKLRSMRKTEKEQAEIIGMLKKEIQKYKISLKQAEEKYDKLEGEITSKAYQIKAVQEQKRNAQDLVRLQKDKRANLEIQIKKVTMEGEINQKDKLNQINRLQRLLESREPQKNREHTYLIKRLEEEVKTKEKRYQFLLKEFESFKKQVNERPPKQVIVEKIVNNNNNEEQFKVFERLMSYMKQQNANQNKMSSNIMNSVLAKFEQKNKENKDHNEWERQREREKSKEQDSALLNEIYTLRRQLIELKESKKEQPQIIVTRDNEEDYYKQRINNLEEELDQANARQKVLNEQIRELQLFLHQKEAQLNNLNENFEEIRQKLRSLQSQNNTTSEGWRMKIRQKEYNFEQVTRQLRKQLDDAEFQIQKTKKQEAFNMNLKRAQYQEIIARLNQENGVILMEKNDLKAEIQKIKAFYEGKIRQKNALLDRASQAETMIKEEHEIALRTYKNVNEQELNKVLQKIEGMAELNQRYTNLSAQYSSNERQLHQLRSSIRKLKSMNDGVDHLWSVKEEEYRNINEVLRGFR